MNKALTFACIFAVSALGCGGEGDDLCDDVECDDDKECTEDACDPANGMCDFTPVEDGTSCGEGPSGCQSGSCVGVFACSEEGIRAAIAVGDGPHTFDCEGLTMVVTKAEIVIDNDVILDGEGNLMVDGGGEHANFMDDHRVFSVAEGVTAELLGFNVTGGYVEEYLGGGGGIWNVGTLTLMNSIVSENTAEGFCNVSRCGGGYGGGIWNVGTMTMMNSTVSENTAEGFCNASRCGNDGYGGGIWNVGTMTMMNSTVSENYGADAGGGIGIGIENVRTMTMMNSTVSENTAFEGGGIVNVGTLTLTNSIIDGDCGAGRDPTSNGYNIESPGDTCGFDHDTDLTEEEDLHLGPLADNGGPTQTHAITTDSPAFNNIPAEDCEVDEDQRGVERPQGPTCDVGAFELEQ